LNSKLQKTKVDLLVIVGCLCLSLVLIELTSSYFDAFVLYLMTTVTLFLLHFNRKSKRTRLILLRTAFIMFVITLLEICALLYYRTFILNAEEAPKYNYGRTQYWIEDDELGFKPKPSILVNARKIYNDKTIYDTEYSIDFRGLRKTKSAGTAQCSFLFFGGSTTFGEGLPDTHTLPYQFSRALNYSYNVLNFGFHGYGPHQMLRTLQRSARDDLSGTRISVVFYVLAPEDGFSTVGASRKYFGGPKYVIRNGHPVYVGKLDSMDGALNSWADFVRSSLTVLRSSQLFNLLYGYPEINSTDYINDIVLLVSKIFLESHLVVKEKYNARFVIIHWSDTSRFSKEIINALKDKDVIMIDKTELLQQSWSSDYLINNDKYPGVKANKEMSAALASQFGFCQG